MIWVGGGGPHSLTQTLSIGAARFGASKVHKEDSLYELVHDQGHPELRGRPHLVREVPLEEGPHPALLLVDLSGAVQDASVLALAWAPDNLHNVRNYFLIYRVSQKKRTFLAF